MHKYLVNDNAHTKPSMETLTCGWQLSKTLVPWGLRLSVNDLIICLGLLTFRGSSSLLLVLCTLKSFFPLLLHCIFVDHFVHGAFAFALHLIACAITFFVHISRRVNIFLPPRRILISLTPLHGIFRSPPERRGFFAAGSKATNS